MQKSSWFCLVAAAGLATALSAPAAYASGPFSELQLNGNAHIGARGELRLIRFKEQASSAYMMTPITLGPSSSFVSKFSVEEKARRKSPQADGFAFVMQNDPAGDKALGYDGNCLAVCNIQNYAAIAFQSYVNDTAGLWLNGTMDTQQFNTGNHNQKVSVTVTYDQVDTTLGFTATNSTTGETVSASYNVDLTTLGPSLYIGFSGASGGAESKEIVKSWTFNFTP